jgi:diketogulonate reductase-like aldo/keto reductase
MLGAYLHIEIQLGLKYVDLFLIHVPRSVENNVEHVWRQFEEVQEAGLTRYGYCGPHTHFLTSFCRSIGVSNFDVEDLEPLVKIARSKPVVNQVWRAYTFDRTSQTLFLDSIPPLQLESKREAS